MPTLHDALSNLPPETLVRIGANALRERERCELAGTDTGQRYAVVWDAIGTVVDRVLVEHSLRAA